MPGKKHRLDNPRDKPRSISHLSDTVDINLAHAARHIDAAKRSPKKVELQANLEHAAKHTKEAADHQTRLGELLATLPGVKQENTKLQKANPNFKRKGAR